MKNLDTMLAVTSIFLFLVALLFVLNDSFGDAAMAALLGLITSMFSGRHSPYE